MKGTVELGTGDTIKTDGLTKLSFGDCFVLFNTKSSATFGVNEKALTIELTSGEALVEAFAPVDLKIKAGEVEIVPVDCAFSLRLDGGKVIVQVDEGNVLGLKAGQQATYPGGAIAKADPRKLAWAKKGRAAERVLLADDFSKAGEWHADLENGIAKSRRDGKSCAARIQIENEKPGLFTTPVDGTITLVYRVEKITELAFVLVGETEHRHIVKLTRINAWQTATIKLSDLVPAGELITKIKLLYGDVDEPVNFALDSIRIVATRP